MEQLFCDIAIVGGGVAGVCAAVAAARCGAKVVLVGNRPVLGGNSSSEVRMWTRGATGGGNLYCEEMGILGEAKLRNRQVNGDGNVLFWCETLLELVVAEKKIRLLLNAQAGDVEMEGNQIRSLCVRQLDSERIFQLRAQTYIDCTGDGTIAAGAGVPFRRGQEARREYGESNAPLVASDQVLGSSIFFYTKKEDHPVRFIAPAYAYKMETIRELVNRGGRILDARQTGSDFWWIEYGGMLDTIRDAEDIAFELRRLVLGVWNYIKNSGQFDADNLTLEWIGDFAGKRESRRMVADYMLTQNDVQSARDFPDNAFYGGWYLDYHPSEGVYSSDSNCTQIPVRVYPIPLRTLFSGACENLLFAGRIIGSTHATFASTRIMDTCALSGQAAGTLAALSVRDGMSPARRAGEPGPVQQRLLYDDMWVLGARNEDLADLARDARIAVTSVLHQARREICGSLPLTGETFLQLAVPAGTDCVRVLAEGPEGARVRGMAYTAPIPSKLCPGEALGEARAEMTGEGELVFALPRAEKNRFVTLILEPCQSVALCAVRRAPLGFLMGYTAAAKRLYPAVSLDYGDLYAPCQLQNGYQFPYGEPGLWISEEEETPALTLSWDAKRTAREIVLYLEPDLAQELPSSFAERWNESHRLERPQSERPWQLAPEVVVEALGENGWERVAAVEDNWQRRVRIRLSQSVTTRSLRVAFPAGSRQKHMAQLFQVRVY